MTWYIGERGGPKLRQSPLVPVHQDTGKDSHRLAVATLNDQFVVQVRLFAIEGLEVCAHGAVVGDVKDAHTLLPGAWRGRGGWEDRREERKGKRRGREKREMGKKHGREGGGVTESQWLDGQQPQTTRNEYN